VTWAFKSRQPSTFALAGGVYAGTRNPFNHEDPADIDEQVALESPAVTNVLAGSVAQSTSERGS
jgi:hypothetical protein